jgi:glycosyltransferase involved in cell wall biosynthesis
VRLFYWIDHTGTYDGNSGVQRVVRGLGKALLELGCEVLPVRWCAERECLVHAELQWIDSLARYNGPSFSLQPDAGCPLHLSADAPALSFAWFVLPEVPHTAGPSSPAPATVFDYARYYGMSIAAVFYDLVPLRFPGYEAMQDLHTRYATALSAVDIIFPISASCGDDLTLWWAEQGFDARRLPNSTVALLPAELAGTERVTQAANRADGEINLLMLGSVEPRKNQLAFSRAFGRLVARRPDIRINLDIVGHIHPAVGAAVDAEAQSCPSIRLRGYLDDSVVQDLLTNCDATVFVSLAEGFGLPISESLWHGIPCICSNIGSMAEIAEGGGCLTVDPYSEAALEAAVEQFATDVALRRRLTHEAQTRPLKRWTAYGQEILTALEEFSPLRRLVVIEGSLGGANRTIAQLRLPEGKIIRLRWHGQTKALLPGFEGAPEEPKIGDGQLEGLWALIADTTLADGEELSEILRLAHGLGLKVSARVQLGSSGAQFRIEAVADLDHIVVRTERQLDQFNKEANANLTRTVGIRAKCEVAPTVSAHLDLLARKRPRLSEPFLPATVRTIYYWCGLTVRQDFMTGVQRVVRHLGKALEDIGIEIVPVKWNDQLSAMTPISETEAHQMERWGGMRANNHGALPADLSGEWLLIPEITLPLLPAGSSPAEYARTRGMRIAIIVHDLIVRKQAELYAPETLAAYEAFWKQFSAADLALPTSRMVTADLYDYLAIKGLRVPKIVSCPLAGEILGTSRVRHSSNEEHLSGSLRILAIGTWETRKNYPRLLRAVKYARQYLDREIDLTIVGRRDTNLLLNEEIERLASEIPGVSLVTQATDDELLHYYDSTDVVVFASWEEGTGLPVLESFWRGKPCLCHDGSSLVELAQCGGALTTNMLDVQSIADALIRLATDRALLAKLTSEASERPIRGWHTYAGDVLSALNHYSSPPGWPLPSIIANRGDRPLLSCCITTYNRAPWLIHSLPRLLEAARPWQDIVEVVVCDNASTDDTPEVIGSHLHEKNLSASRNQVNVGMLGNLGATARAARGAFIWVLGDDDLVVEGALENVLDGLVAHPEAEMAYMNYSYTRFDAPDQLRDATEVVRGSTAISPPGPNRFVRELREVSPLNENLFTAIYACAFRRDHALRAYQQDVRGAPFTSLVNCVPSSVYALSALQHRPAWWVGEPAVVVNMNVSWLRWALLWHLERIPDLYEMAELNGVRGELLEAYRSNHCADTPAWIRATYFQAEDSIRLNFSMSRLLERTKHLPKQRDIHLSGIRQAYTEAWEAGRVGANAIPPDELFSSYGLRTI